MSSGTKSLVAEVGVYDTEGYQSTSPQVSDYNRKLDGVYSVMEDPDGWPPAKYLNYLPVWEHDCNRPLLEPFHHVDPGLRADPTFADLLHQHTTRIDLTPLAGSEISGVQLSKLSNSGKDQLALLVAQRKVVVFRDQDFSELPIDGALDYCRHFGRLNIHPTTGSPKGYPEVHVAHRGPGGKAMEQVFGTRTNSITWHSDTSYERQPAGITFMYILEQPQVGGDTIFSNNVEAFNRLSEPFRRILNNLEAVHSGIQLAETNRAQGGRIRREPATNVHPVVRTHPLTNEKSLFVNPAYVKHIVGFKTEESDAILKYLFEHIATGLDFHVRVKWQENSVVVFDNRLTCHAATHDWINGERRHLARITPEAEKPFVTPFTI